MTPPPNHDHTYFMARQARIVIPNTAHHVSQRGNRGDFVFFKKADYQTYLDIVKEQCDENNIALYSYCLIPNQIHLLVEPRDATTLGKAIGEAHRRYTNIINAEQNWSGHLFQNRFFSYAADAQYALRAARYIETLPVSLKLTPQPEKYLWSSAKSRLKVSEDSIVKPFQSFHAVQDWDQFLSRPMNEDEINQVQLHLQTGRPRGSDLFLDAIERKIGRPVRPQKRGRKPKNKTEAA